MKTSPIQSAPLGKQTPPGHTTLSKPMAVAQAARLWARNNPDPASIYARRRNKRGGQVSAPQTYRVFIPATQKTLAFGSRGSAAISEWGILRRLGQNPELLCPGVEIKVSCLLTEEDKTGTVETK